MLRIRMFGGHVGLPIGCQVICPSRRIIDLGCAVQAYGPSSFASLTASCPYALASSYGVRPMLHPIDLQWFGNAYCPSFPYLAFPQKPFPSFSCLPALTHGARTSALGVHPDWLSEAFREMPASFACAYPFAFLTRQDPPVSARILMSRSWRSTQGGERCAHLLSGLTLSRSPNLK